MGQMQFLAPNRERVPSRALESAYIAGQEGIPWQSRTFWRDDCLVVEREIGDSGNFHLAWATSNHGEMVLSTASLAERDEPYLLPVELARGTLNRLRNQMESWKMAGLELSPRILEYVQAATESFVRSATSQQDLQAAARHADLSIDRSLEGVFLLAEESSRQMLACRHQQMPRLGTLFAVEAPANTLSPAAEKAFLATFNSCMTPFRWSQIEKKSGQFDWKLADAQIRWCQEHDLKVCSGPLLRLSAHDLPDWLFLWEGDFDRILDHAVKFAEAVVQRYSGRVHVWTAVSRMNVGQAMVLNEEQRFRLAVGMIEAVRRTDPRTPVIVNFDQPWAEYLANSQTELSPFHFADALVRAELGVAGIGLELNYGYWPGGSLARDVLECSRQIDRWAQFGLPLLIEMLIPSSSEEDASAWSRAVPVAGGANEFTPETQALLAESLATMFISKQSVHGLIWSQLSDAARHEFSHGGVFDAKWAPKPLMQALAKIRRAHLT